MMRQYGITKEQVVDLAISAVFLLILATNILNAQNSSKIFMPADVPMLFFISDGYMPENNAAWHKVPRDYTNNEAEYIDLPCGHYCHVEEADRMNTEIRRFLDTL